MARLNRRTRKSSVKSKQPLVNKRVGKDKLLIKAIIRVAMIGIAAVLALFGLMSFLQSLQAAKEQEKAPAQSQLGEVQSKTSTLVAQLDSLGEAAQIYTALNQTRSNMQFNVDPLAIRPLLTALKAKYHITTLSIEFKSREPVPIEDAGGEMPKAERHEVVMTIGSMSDHFIYQFIQELTQQLNGFIQVQSLEASRTQPMSIEVLTKISRGMKVETATASLRFYWYGYKEPDAKAQADNAAPASEQITGDGNE